MTRSSTPRVTLVAVLVAALMAGCAAGSSTPVVRTLPAAVLDDYDLRQAMDAETARRALDDVTTERGRLNDALIRERIACYQRFFTTRCLSEVATRERLVNARLDAVQGAANQRLREDRALQSNERIARDLERREAQAGASAETERANRERQAERLRIAAEDEARRAEQAPELERRAVALKAERERRERELAQREAAAAERAAGDAQRAAARERELEAARQRKAAADARQAEREARRRGEPVKAP